MELLIIWFLFAIAAMIAAGKRNRSRLGYFLLGFIIGPFALLFVLLAGEKPRVRMQFPLTSEESNLTKTCPICAEKIRLAAKKCRYCGYEFNEQELAEQTKIVQEIKAKQRCPFCQGTNIIKAADGRGGTAPYCQNCRKLI